MAESQPIVCAFLRLPPEQQPFFRMKEIAYMFLQKLNHLSLALVVSQDAHNPLVKQTLEELREAAGDQCSSLASAMYFGVRFATRYLQLLDALTKEALGDETIYNFLNIHSNAGLAADEMEGVHKGMIKFGQEIADATRRIMAALSDSKNLETFTAENSQVVTELVHAVDECSTLLQRICEYYREMETRFEDKELIKSNPPSEEEIKFMQERWTVFAQSIADIKGGFGILRNRILIGPDVHQVGTSYRPSDHGTQNTTSANSSGPADKVQRQAILDASASGATSTDPPPPTKAKSFLGSFLQRLLSCLRLKHFD